MNTIKDGGPAFARTFAEVERDRILMKLEPAKIPFGTDGMSLRDYMAIHASEADIVYQGEVIRSAQVCSGGIGVLPDGWRITARYMHADAMLAARDGAAA